MNQCFGGTFIYILLKGAFTLVADEPMLEPVLLCVRGKQKPQLVMLADAYGVNIPIVNFKLQVTECSVWNMQWHNIS